MPGPGSTSSVPFPKPICWKLAAAKVAANSIVVPGPYVVVVGSVLNLAPSMLSLPLETVDVPPDDQGNDCQLAFDGQVSKFSTVDFRVTSPLAEVVTEVDEPVVPKAKSTVVSSTKHGGAAAVVNDQV